VQLSSLADGYKPGSGALLFYLPMFTPGQRCIRAWARQKCICGLYEPCPAARQCPPPPTEAAGVVVRWHSGLQDGHELMRTQLQGRFICWLTALQPLCRSALPVGRAVCAPSRGHSLVHRPPLALAGKQRTVDRCPRNHQTSGTACFFKPRSYTRMQSARGGKGVAAATCGRPAVAVNHPKPASHSHGCGTCTGEPSRGAIPSPF